MQIFKLKGSILNFSKVLVILLSMASLSNYYFQIVLISNRHYPYIKILYEVDGLFMPGRMRAKSFEVQPLQDSLVELSCCQTLTYSSTKANVLFKNILHHSCFLIIINRLKKISILNYQCTKTKEK